MTGGKHFDWKKLHIRQLCLAVCNIWAFHAGSPRVWLTSKLHPEDANGTEAVLQAFEASRRRLGVEQLDLCLIHWPGKRGHQRLELDKTDGPDFAGISFKRSTCWVRGIFPLLTVDCACREWATWRGQSC